jgi:hypothetical protein
LNFATPANSFDFSSANATDEWLLQETSGTYANNVGSETLSNDTGMQGQTAVGLYNGTDHTSRNAWESTATAANPDSLVASGTTAGDSDGTDFCFRVVFRSAVSHVSSDQVITKWDNSVGWECVTKASGHMRFRIDDGTTERTADLAVNHGDGAWHYVTGWYDASADMMYVKSDLASEVSTDTSAVTGSLSNSAPFCLNTGNGAGSTLGLPSTQYAYGGVCVGANAQAMYDEEIVLPGTDPTGLLTTTDRDSLISVEVEDGYVCHFAGSTTTPQLPIGYHAGFTSGYGLYCNSAVQNLQAYSEDFSNWILANTTITANFADAPDGFRNATEVTATIGNGFIYRNPAPIAADTQYTFSVWVKRNGGSDVTGKLRVRDLDAAVNTDQAFTATDTWQRVSVTHTHGSTTTLGDRNYIYVDTVSESILIWGAQHELGDKPGAYIRTLAGAAVTLDPSTYHVASLAHKPAKGETSCTYVPVRSTATATIYTFGSGADRKYVTRGTNGNLNCSVYDDVQAVEDTVASGAGTSVLGTEDVLRHVWDEADGVSGSYESAIVLNGTTTNGAAHPWEGTATAGQTSETLQIAKNVGAGNYHDLWFQSFDVYDAQNGDLP